MSKMTFHLQRQCSCKSDSVPTASKSREVSVSLNGDYNLVNRGNRGNPAPNRGNRGNLENPAHLVKIVKILLGFPIVPSAYSSSCQRDNLSGWEFVKVLDGSIRPADLKTFYARGIA